MSKDAAPPVKALLPTSSMVGMSPLMKKSPVEQKRPLVEEPLQRKPLPTLSSTLQEMIDNFKAITAGLALPGQKKRLQNHHIDMVIG